MVPKICSKDDCSRPHHARSFCDLHYRHAAGRAPRELGGSRKPVNPKPRLSIEGRFWAKVDKTASCWNWNGAQHRTGHGQFKVNGKYVGAYRFSYEMANGAIPTGLVIDHICHNPPCVNPSHLRAVTQKQNLEHQTRAHANSKSGVRGVYKSIYGKWRAAVRHNGKHISAGHFDSLEDAEAAVIAKRNELFTCNDADRRIKN